MTTLAELKAEAARLNARIADLEGSAANRSPPPSPPKDESGVRVTKILAERRGLPALDEMRKLLALVRTHVPGADRVTVGDDPDRLLRGFCACFRRVANLRRLPEPNKKYAVGWWIDDTKAWLKERDAMTIDVTGTAFVAAVLAQGDVVWQKHDPMLGRVFEAGLATYGGTPADPNAWKRVLQGDILSPTTRRYA